MSVTAVVGGQWGDEGKGRIVDYLAQQADVVIRFQGGDNAGHTVVNEHGTFALHIIPSGIFNPRTRCVVGAGTVVNPEGLAEELELLHSAGVTTDNLFISRRAHVVLPLHRTLDGLEEAARRGDDKIGTTKRGIGPTYADRAARIGIRVGDLLDPDHLRSRIANLVERKNKLLASFDAPPVDPDALTEQAIGWGRTLSDRIVDTVPILRAALDDDAEILLEGQLGVMRDLDWGIYPYVTSSHPTAAAAPVGAGLPLHAISDVVGVVKTYSTAVGAGPFPVELHDASGEKLRRIGKEFGATTGRPRRCGWFDGVAIRYAAWLNGFTALAVTKLDVLDTFDEIRVCVRYRLPDGSEVETMPDTRALAAVEPVYETLPGWNSSTRDARSWDDLPTEAQALIERISELADTPIRFVSVGPERESLVVTDG